jgi:hypothetical protein
MQIETETYILPECLACYAMYGESCGDEELETAYDEWLGREMKGFSSMHLVDISNEPSFMRHHELHSFGIGSCDTLEFTFHTTKQEDN